jgi:iron complex outermembrane receptor protein
MQMTGRNNLLWLWRYRAGALLAFAAPLAVQAADIEEIVVWSKAAPAQNGPSVSLTPADLASANIVTTEDLVKYEPSIIIRRRFIGDANGTMGMRGANMFQTSRSMVFADGVPLHYLLQSRWDGAPRWSMIAASEIASIEVLYGPFSAEYGGNSMGGVVLMESSIPQQREFHFENMTFMQDFSAYGFDDTLQGYKSFLSYGDKLGNTSVYLSWNHLNNASQPQSFFFGAAPGKGEALPVSGAISGNNERSQHGVWFGDTGVIDNVTDNFKLKIGYELGDWSALLNIAYESRATDATRPNSYVRDADGNRVYSGTVMQDGFGFAMPATRFGISNGQRDSLSGALRVKGWLSDHVALESNINWFGVLRDETRTSARNPADPAWTPAGQITDFGPTGWRTSELKLNIDVAAIDGLSVVTGVRHEDYRLALDVFESANYRQGSKDSYSARSGGATSLDAAFVQAKWNLSAQWDLQLGARYERWQSSKGYYGNDKAETPEFDLVRLPTRRNNKLSPKFTLGFYPSDDWSLHYSVARAYRFAIVEELFSQYQAFNAVNQANPELAPESGLHHNVSVAREINNGELQLNFFQESIRDVIEAQSTTLPGGISVRTFLPVTEVQTKGIELIANRDDLLLAGLNLRFNLAWTHSEITRNLTAPELVGKRYPRMPSWRANLLLNYQLTPTVDVGGGLRYASDSFGTLDNSDHEHGVYGAQDDYTFVNLKANWKPSPRLQFGLGIDNLFNELAWVAHPWPARTVFLEGSLRL